MKKHLPLLLLGAGVAAGVAYLVAQFGRASAAGKLAGQFGDQEAKDVAASLSLPEAFIAGVRSIAGYAPLTANQVGDVYTVS